MGTTSLLVATFNTAVFEPLVCNIPPPPPSAPPPHPLISFHLATATLSDTLFCLIGIHRAVMDIWANQSPLSWAVILNWAICTAIQP